MKTSADVVVIGGGILGTAIAVELAGSGADVALVERAAIGAGASGRNHGLIFRPEHPALQDLFRASLDSYRALAGVTPLRLALDEAPQGLLLVATEEGDWPAAEREATVAALGGLAIERLDAQGLREAEPALSEGHLGGFLIQDGIRVDPAALTLALAYQARAAGAELTTNCEVKQVLVAQGRVRGVATDDGRIAAPVVVNAAGPWAAKVARTAGVPEVPIGGIRGWLLLAQARPDLMRHLVVSAGWHLGAGDGGPGPITVGDHELGPQAARRDVGCLVQQNAGGPVLLGGSRATSLAEQPEGPEVTAQIAARAAQMVPALRQAAILAAWSGVRPTSPDGLPLIGWIPGVEGFFLAGGHGGAGVTLGAGSARLAGALLAGRAPFTDPRPYDPARFTGRQASPGIGL